MTGWLILTFIVAFILGAITHRWLSNARQTMDALLAEARSDNTAPQSILGGKSHGEAS